jgi:hypothetical protein
MQIHIFPWRRFPPKIKIDGSPEGQENVKLVYSIALSQQPGEPDPASRRAARRGHCLAALAPFTPAASLLP